MDESRLLQNNSLPMHMIPPSIKSIVEKNFQPWPNMSEECTRFLNLFKLILDSEIFQLNEHNYVNILKLMLYVEEVHNEILLRKFDMYDQRIYTRVLEKVNYFEIVVEGLVEESPSIVVNDQIKLIDVDTEKSYIVVVKQILEQSVLVVPQRFKGSESFDKIYRPGKRFNVKFVLNIYPYQCCHYTLTLLESYGLIPRLFPQTIQAPRKVPSSDGVRWFNEYIHKNPEQRQAVINILNRSSSGLPYIVYGPPGTGKTATLIEAICQAWMSTSCRKILVCTPSNDTADSFTKRLQQYIPKKDLLRMYSLSKDPDTIDKDLIGCSNCIDGEIIKFTANQLPKIVITTLCTSTRLLVLNLKVSFFSYVFIDEAGQAIEPDTIIPFTLLSSEDPQHKGRIHGQVVLAGDPQQLGPVIFSRVANKILEKSMLERLLNHAPYRKNNYNRYDPRFITKLVRNYRSHPCLIHVSNQLFYEKELMSCANEERVEKALGWRGLPNPNFPIMFDEVYGDEAKNFRSPSSFNEVELRAVMNHVHSLLKNRLFNQGEIGIVTPFTAQKIRLKSMLKDEGLTKVEVGTVQLFQGREKDVIIFTAVRSRIFHNGTKPIGFLSDARRFNVAMTRAKCLQIVVGNPQVLEVDENWAYLLTYCRRHNASTGGIPIKYVTRKNKQRGRKEDRKIRMKKKSEEKEKSSIDDDCSSISSRLSNWTIDSSGSSNQCHLNENKFYHNQNFSKIQNIIKQKPCSLDDADDDWSSYSSRDRSWSIGSSLSNKSCFDEFRSDIMNKMKSKTNDGYTFEDRYSSCSGSVVSEDSEYFSCNEDKSNEPKSEYDWRVVGSRRRKK